MTDFIHSRVYDGRNYNCAHFVCELFKHETGIDISQYMTGFLKQFNDREMNIELKNKFKLIQKPENLSVVLMRRPSAPPHVGLFIRGKIAQITLDGVSFLPIHQATFNYTSVRFYKWQSN